MIIKFLQIVHLKRFNCVHGKWVKSQKVVHFPFDDFDPTPYLASVPQETILRHKELLELNEVHHHQSRSFENDENIAGKGDSKLPNIDENDIQQQQQSNQCNNNETTNSEPYKSHNNITNTLEKDQNLNHTIYDTAAEEYRRHHNVANKKNNEQTELQHQPHLHGDIEDKDNVYHLGENEQDEVVMRNSNPKLEKRKRLISSSLTKTPIIDGEFEDFHQHKLRPGEDAFNPKYKLYAVVVS